MHSKLECIDDAVGPAVAAPSTVRPRMRNKGTECVLSCLLAFQAKLSFGFHSKSLLTHAAHAERQQDASRYLTCWQLAFVVTCLYACSTSVKTLYESDGEHSAYSAECRQLEMKEAVDREGQSGPSNEEVCDVVEGKAETVPEVPDKYVVSSAPTEDQVHVALELMPVNQRDTLLADDYDSLPHLRQVAVSCRTWMCG